MGLRPGLTDILMAFAVISGVVTLADMLERSRTRASAQAGQAIDRVRLKRIEQNVAALHEKL